MSEEEDMSALMSDRHSVAAVPIACSQIDAFFNLNDVRLQIILSVDTRWKGIVFYTLSIEIVISNEAMHRLKESYDREPQRTLQVQILPYITCVVSNLSSAQGLTRKTHISFFLLYKLLLLFGEQLNNFLRSVIRHVTKVPSED